MSITHIIYHILSHNPYILPIFHGDSHVDFTEVTAGRRRGGRGAALEDPAPAALRPPGADAPGASGEAANGCLGKAFTLWWMFVIHGY